MDDIITINNNGSWIECINPFRLKINHYFFRHIPSDPRFANNDKAKICPVCWSQAETRNQKLYSGYSNQTLAQKNHKTTCTPEKDSL